MRLEDKVGLTGEPVTRVLEVQKHRLNCIVGRCIGGIGRRRGRYRLSLRVLLHQHRLILGLGGCGNDENDRKDCVNPQEGCLQEVYKISLDQGHNCTRPVF
jgi:hypothetical protein